MSRVHWDRSYTVRQMFPAIAMALMLVFVARSVAAAVSHDPDASPPQKSNLTSTSWSPPIEVLVGGDNAGSAVAIPGLPYTDSGNTCAFLNDYALLCPGTPGEVPAPDVVYSFVPGSNMCVNISVCNSNFDVGLYVWENAVGNMIACNDDACGPTGQQSRVAGLSLTAGNTYYIVVDAFGGCGDYNLSLSECLPPCTPLACPGGAVPEGEPTCFAGYVDATNGGCNASPNVYQAITVPATICGTYGIYCADPIFCFSTLRDTDWYQIVLTSTKTLRFCVQGEIPTQFDVVDAITGCGTITIVPGSLGFPLACETFCVDLTLAAGTYWPFVSVAPSPTSWPCGSRYVLTVTDVTTGVDDNGLTLDFSLDQNTPNPTRGGSTTIAFTLPEAASAQLVVYDALGGRVRTLASGLQSAGRNRVVWDGRDNAGEPVNAGVYFCKLTSGSLSTSRTIIVME